MIYRVTLALVDDNNDVRIVAVRAVSAARAIERASDLVREKKEKGESFHVVSVCESDINFVLP